MNKAKGWKLFSWGMVWVLAAHIAPQARLAESRDTILVTRIESQDTTGNVLAVHTQTWEMIDSERLRQRQFAGAGAGAKKVLEQLFDREGRTLQTLVLDSSGQILRRSDYTYAAQGRSARLDFFDASAQASWRHQVIALTYREDGQIEGMKVADTLGAVLSEWVYRYDAEGREQEAEEKRQGAIFQLVRHQRSQDKLLDTVFTLLQGTDTVEARLKTYNAQGKVLSEWVSVRLPNRLWFSRETRSVYDVGGRLQREDNYNGQGVLIGRIVYTNQAVTLTAPSTRLIVENVAKKFRNGVGERTASGLVYGLDGRLRLKSQDLFYSRSFQAPSSRPNFPR
jgi:hypothetical protein